MKFLLDTNIVIYHLNDVPAATSIIDALFDEGVSISVITYVEVVEGLERSSKPDQAHQQFSEFIDEIPMINFTRLEAEELINIRLALRQHGREVRRRALDLQIAATAVAHSMTLVTNDPHDYTFIPGLVLLPAQIKL